MEYHRPDTLAQARELLESLDEALPLAGGTDVVVDLKAGLKSPRHVVSLHAIPELHGVVEKNGALVIGALTTPAELAASKVVRNVRPELGECVKVFGGPQVRNRATVGGNLCTAASCADLPPMLLALNATVTIHGERELPLAEFFVDNKRTVLRRGEIVTHVTVPARREGEGAAYEAFGRRGGSFITAAGVAAVVCKGTARLGLGAVAPTPLLVEAPLEEAPRKARAAVAPITDIRGTAEHRAELVEVLARRAIGRAQR